MNLKPVRKFHKALSWTTGIIKDNPVLALGMALPFAVIASTTLKRGVLMSAVMFVAIVPAVIISQLVKKNIPQWLKLPFGCGVSICCVNAFVQNIKPDYPVLLQDLGVYVPLAAFNMILLESISDDNDNGVLPASWMALKMCVGFTLVMCVLSAIGELMVYRTIWDVNMPFAELSISGAGLPCFGFILLGFFAAFFRWIGRLYLQFTLSRQKKAEREEGAV